MSRTRSGPQENGLWYDSKHGYPPASWLRDWQRLVRLVAGDAALTGVDLFNEPHSTGMLATCASYLTSGASWGTCNGRRNPQTDWHAAAVAAGNALLAINPHLLIVVEGVSAAPQGKASFEIAVAGGNLMAAGSQPVRLRVPHQLVYSAHDYYNSRLVGYLSWAQLRARWTRLFGYLTNPTLASVAPVWIGDFGTCNSQNAGRGCAEAIAADLNPPLLCPRMVPDPHHPGRFVPACSCRKAQAQKGRHTAGYWFEAFVPYLNTPPYRGAPPFGWAYWPAQWDHTRPYMISGATAGSHMKVSPIHSVSWTRVGAA